MSSSMMAIYGSNESPIGMACAPNEFRNGDIVRVPLYKKLMSYSGNLGDKPFDPISAESALFVETVNVTKVMRGGQMWLYADDKAAQKLVAHLADGGTLS